MTSEPKNEEGLDFSKHMNKVHGKKEEALETQISESKNKPKIPKRVKILIAIVVILAILQVLILVLSRPPRPQAPTPSPATLNNSQTNLQS